MFYLLKNKTTRNQHVWVFTAPHTPISTKALSMVCSFN